MPNQNPSQVVRPALYGQDALALARAAQEQNVSIAEVIRQLVRQHLGHVGHDGHAMSDMSGRHDGHAMPDMVTMPDMSDTVKPKAVNLPSVDDLLKQRF